MQQQHCWVTLGCAAVLLLALTACGGPANGGVEVPPVTPASTPTAVATARPTLDSAALLVQLQRTAALDEAVGHCAALIGAAADQARIRIETSKEQDCVPCNRLPIGSLSRGAPIDEIALPPEAGSLVWVTIGDLLCIYLFDGQEYRPSAVTHW